MTGKPTSVICDHPGGRVNFEETYFRTYVDIDGTMFYSDPMDTEERAKEHADYIQKRHPKKEVQIVKETRKVESILTIPPKEKK